MAYRVSRPEAYRPDSLVMVMGIVSLVDRVDNCYRGCDLRHDRWCYCSSHKTVITVFNPRCAICRARGNYESRDKTPTHKLAEKDGWRVRGRVWLCRSCYRKEHGMEVSDGIPGLQAGGLQPDNEQPDRLQSIRQALSKKLALTGV